MKRVNDGLVVPERGFPRAFQLLQISNATWPGVRARQLSRRHLQPAPPEAVALPLERRWRRCKRSASVESRLRAMGFAWQCPRWVQLGGGNLFVRPNARKCLGSWPPTMTAVMGQAPSSWNTLGISVFPARFRAATVRGSQATPLEPKRAAHEKWTSESDCPAKSSAAIHLRDHGRRRWRPNVLCLVV